MMTLSLSLLDTPAYTYTHTHTSTLTSGNKDNLHDDLDGQPVCTVPNVQVKTLKSQLPTEFTTRNYLKLTFSELICVHDAARVDGGSHDGIGRHFSCICVHVKVMRGMTYVT